MHPKVKRAATNQLGKSAVYKQYEPYLYRISPADSSYGDFQPPPLTHTFTPTLEEFKDPLKFITSLWEYGRHYGICKIKPPEGWDPPFAMNYDKFKFSTRKQRIHELEARTRRKLNFIGDIKQYWYLQGIDLEFPPMVRGKEVDLHSLYHFVEDAGGFDKANSQRHWYLITKTLGFAPACCTEIKRTYKKYLYSYELFCQNYKPKEVKEGIQDITKVDPIWRKQLSLQCEFDPKKIRLSGVEYASESEHLEVVIENVLDPGPGTSTGTGSDSQMVKPSSDGFFDPGPSTSTGIGLVSQLVKPSSDGFFDPGPSTSTEIGLASQLVKPSSDGFFDPGPTTSIDIEPHSLVIKEEPDDSNYQGINSSTDIPASPFIKIEPDDDIYPETDSIEIPSIEIDCSQFIKEELVDNTYQETSSIAEQGPGSKSIEPKKPRKSYQETSSMTEQGPGSKSIQPKKPRKSYQETSSMTEQGLGSKSIEPKKPCKRHQETSNMTKQGPGSTPIEPKKPCKRHQETSNMTKQGPGSTSIEPKKPCKRHQETSNMTKQGPGSTSIEPKNPCPSYQETSNMTEQGPGSTSIEEPCEGVEPLTDHEMLYVMYYASDEVKAKLQASPSEEIKGTSEVKQNQSEDVEKGQIKAQELSVSTENNTIKNEACLPKKRGRKKKIVEELPQTSAEEPIKIKSEPPFFESDPDPFEITIVEHSLIKTEYIEPEEVSEYNEGNGFTKIKEDIKKDNIKEEQITGRVLRKRTVKNILPKEISLPKKRGRKKKIVEDLAPTPAVEPISIKIEPPYIEFEPSDIIAHENITNDDDATVDSMSKYICLKCNKGDEEELMLLCDGCDDSYHTFCLQPALDFIPEGDWRCPNCIACVLHVPKEPYGFDHSQEETTLRDFMHKASAFKSEMFGNKDVSSTDFEKQYWNLVSRMDIKNLDIEYGTDLRSSYFGSGFPTERTKHLVEDPNVDEYIKSPWNLKNLPTLPPSLLRYTTNDISGMTEPWMYAGMCLSTFCWHIEDHWSFSINYLHVGDTKTWYGVPGNYAEKFEKAFEDTAPDLFEGNPGLLQQLTTIINPNVFIRRGIPVYKVDQAAGEFVITFPRAYHSGFNQGFNFAEAVNFTLPEWIPIGRECLEYYSFHKRPTVFSHDELIITMAQLPVKDIAYTHLRLIKNLRDDMLLIYLTEYKYRKRLRYWGCTNSQKYYFEFVSDDNRQCDYCQTTCFVSCVSCWCEPSKIACHRHYKLVCDCPPSNHYLRYRLTVRELMDLVKKLRYVATASQVLSHTYVSKSLEQLPLVSSKTSERRGKSAITNKKKRLQK